MKTKRTVLVLGMLLSFIFTAGIHAQTSNNSQEILGAWIMAGEVWVFNADGSLTVNGTVNAAVNRNVETSRYGISSDGSLWIIWREGFEHVYGLSFSPDGKKMTWTKPGSNTKKDELVFYKML